jgi:phenylpyruvate tautomerase PptA (4-oxalocrotonate tautomerase family)
LRFSTPATAEDKKALSRQVTEIYARIPIPKFYVVTLFEEVEKDSLFVGGEPHNRFIRFRTDHMART